MTPGVSAAMPTGLMQPVRLITQGYRHGFTGHENINEIDLVHMNGRVYDPTLGRFLSPDPHVQFEALLISYNRYAYVNNNPLR